MAFSITSKLLDPSKTPKNSAILVFTQGSQLSPSAKKIDAFYSGAVANIASDNAVKNWSVTSLKVAADNKPLKQIIVVKLPNGKKKDDVETQKKKLKPIIAKLKNEAKELCVFIDEAVFELSLNEFGQLCIGRRYQFRQRARQPARQPLHAQPLGQVRARPRQNA